MNRFTLNLFLVLLLAFFAFAVVAQNEEATEEAPIVEAPAEDIAVIPDTEEVAISFEIQFTAFVALVITALWNLIYIPVAAPLVEILTSVSKRITPLKNVSATSITFFFTVVAWLAFVVLSQLGLGDRFDTVITGLATIASAVFGIPLTQVAASGIHTFAQKNNVPVFGYSRTPNIGKQFGDAVEKAIDDMVNKMVDVTSNNSSQGENVLTPIAEMPRD